MSLRERLRALIAAEGPITVADFMATALHDPKSGYYATRPALGEAGDFLTAPLVSQMFGELVGLWCASTWLALGRPTPFRWVEFGPGDGTLMADARRAVARALPACVAAADIVFVETSPVLRERQRAAMGGAPPTWVETLDEVPGLCPIIAIGNEFLDCLPARQLVRTATGWAERRVGLDARGVLAFGLAPAPADFVAPPEFDAAPEGAVLELSPDLAAFGLALGARIAGDGGAALFVDYGRAEPGLGDTLQALRRHEKVDVLATVGETDLTVHADFPTFAAAARTAGAETTAVVTQAELLSRLGIVERAEALAQSRPDKADAIGRQLQRLMAPSQMGELFKAVVVHQGGLPVPAFADDTQP